MINGIGNLTRLNSLSVGEAVAEYMRLELPVFPCRPGGKEPATRRGFKDAIRWTPDLSPELLRAVPEWFDQHTYNVGIATGTVLDVLDVDVKNGKPGLSALRTLRDAGVISGAVSYARTPSGGWHLFFPAAGQPSRSLPSLGLDLKAEGGYVVAAPSSVISFDGHEIKDQAYTWVEASENPAGAPLAWSTVESTLGVVARPRTAFKLSDWIDGVEESVPDTVAGLATWLRKQYENRNAATYWAANRAVEAGARTEEELAPLVEASLAAALPTDRFENREAELWKTVRSALKH